MSGPSRKPMQLHVDWTRCDGHGACAELLPELLTTDEWGYPVRREPEPDPTDGPGSPYGTDVDVPPSLAAYADRARRACPLQALRLV